jgi:hypothetical protein
VGIGCHYSGAPRYEFKPGLEFEVGFKLLSPSENTLINITGSLSEYATPTKEIIPFRDGPEFTVKFKLPNNVKSTDFRPGKNTIWVRVAEYIRSDSNNRGMFSVKTGAGYPIIIDIPYPGYYVEFSEFDLPNVNSGADTYLEFELWNRGINDLQNTFYTFELKDNNNNILINKLEMGVNIKTQTKEQFYIAPIESSDLTPGNYNATLVYSYAGNILEKSVVFKVGQLNMDIINHTLRLYNDSIQRFDINVVSDWNQKITGVYAEVQLGKINAKTTPSDLGNFQEKTLSAFLDSSGLEIKNHTINITLFYATKQRELQSTLEIVERPVIEEPVVIDWMMIILIVLISAMIITTIIFITMFMKKTKSDKLKSKQQKQKRLNKSVGKKNGAKTKK